MPAAWSL
ncbi:hypothetical protein Patl1_21725 [Pistacia atlantica]|nr:hypothetical protein Patl1_21725 [Pistacia atlantica]